MNKGEIIRAFWHGLSIENSIDKKALGLLFPTITGRSVWRVGRWRVFEFKVRSLFLGSSMLWGQ
ncbi:hypothetical protein BFG60_3662 [Microcystis aeruginosa NIES-98]|nr:hypothetical protein BFG60_3662 [Microcystis aeruginosa NIES-98]